MVTVTDWESFKKALREDRRTEAVEYLQRVKEQNPDHADHCERLLFHFFNGRGMWTESYRLATKSVKGDNTAHNRLERIKQLMEVWGDQKEEMYRIVVATLESTAS